MYKSDNYVHFPMYDYYFFSNQNEYNLTFPSSVNTKNLKDCDSPA